MICPKCEGGTIKEIIFKKDKRVASLCDFCGAVWYEDESIGMNTGHYIHSLTKGDDMVYTFIDADANNEELKSVMYSEFK
jgi:uncharacterized Zn finger protein